MNILELLKSRRSVRQFTNQKISDEKIRQILEAAMSAPSAYNHQPWQFIVIHDKKILHQITALDHYKSIDNPQTAIVVCGDFHKEQSEQFLIQSCTTAIENILIAVHGMELGSVCTSIFPFSLEMELFRMLLKLPEHIMPISFMPIGYPLNKMNTEVHRYDSSKVHDNHW